MKNVSVSVFELVLSMIVMFLIVAVGWRLFDATMPNQSIVPAYLPEQTAPTTSQLDPTADQLATIAQRMAKIERSMPTTPTPRVEVDAPDRQLVAIEKKIASLERLLLATPPAPVVNTSNDASLAAIEKRMAKLERAIMDRLPVPSQSRPPRPPAPPKAEPPKAALPSPSATSAVKESAVTPPVVIEPVVSSPPQTISHPILNASDISRDQLRTVLAQQQATTVSKLPETAQTEAVPNPPAPPQKQEKLSEESKTGYYVTVGCFALQENANAMFLNVQKLAVPVYQTQVYPSEQTQIITCIVSGPIATREEAYTIAQKVRKALGVVPLVKKYPPPSHPPQTISP
ncbi:MAG: SPOR domain-containing protein [Magnetococcus sp. DMHC-6]